MKFAIGAHLRTAATGAMLAMPAISYAMTATDIMKSSDDMYRKAFTTAVIKVKLSTCRYVVAHGGMNCKESPRVTVLEVGEKKWGADKKDSRAISLVLQPVTDKGIGMLTYEYADSDRENDVLLYLPALEKVRRVVSGGDGNEDGGSFFGTEFFVDDTQLKKVDDYTYTLIGDDVQDGRPVWVVESTPTEKRARKTQYGKSRLWVDKERKLILREDIYNRAGKMYRQRLNKDFALIDNVWIARQQTMNNLSTNRITLIQNLSAAYNKDVPDELMSERSLTDFTFKEKILATLRSHYK
ncbi:outer membrane lipoprotein-sorting protein [Massilia rhizosphaerae]|uniref:outer membrane lipoprotein-sorting protein n=1 Tax=Massilia rhizosphaerae TaxID=2784389 RepID=UPI0018DB6FDB|nr:outer membrane lipoprotein-sorting protein [Massilia rhizosphaerae]HWU67430.1 outer membrane lipoprotein-sorting protein [Stenotrophobium sp.]